MHATPKKAFITGITGQDGSYLAELLLAKGYEVHGLIRRASTFNTHRIDHLYTDPHEADAKLFLHYGDLSDGSRLVVDARYYQASTSELYGATPPPQHEDTPFYPRSPYGAAKIYSYWITKNYREAYDMYAVNGILFNHESPRRGETFVTRKITRAVAAIKAGTQEKLYMGNLQAIRDWGYAAEYVEGMWRMLQADEPEDFVLATGHPCTVREFLEISFDHAGLDWREHVEFDERYLRPTEVDALIGDPAKAKDKLGWEATVKAPELAKLMVDADIALLENDAWIDTVDLASWAK